MPRFAILLTTLVWGATFPATKAVLEQVPPLTFLFLRFLLGTALVFSVVWISGRSIPRDRFTLRISLIATVWLFLGYVLQTVGLRYTSASNSAFITALYIVFVPLYLKRLNARVWLGIGLALFGLWLLVKPSADVNIGDVLTVGCAAAFAAHIACLERFTRVGDPVAVFSWQLVFVTIAMTGMMTWESPAPSAFEPTPVFLVALGVTGVLATGAFAVQMWAQRLVPAQEVSLLFSIEPAYAAWLAWLFLGESMNLQGWIGSGFILAGVVVGSLLQPSIVRPESLAAESAHIA